MVNKFLSPEATPQGGGGGPQTPKGGGQQPTKKAGKTAQNPALVPGMTKTTKASPLGPDYELGTPNFTTIEQTEIAASMSDLEGGKDATDVIKVNIEDGGLIEKYNTTGPLYNVYLKKEHVKQLIASGRIVTKSADRSPVKMSDLG